MPRPQRPWFRFYVEAIHDTKLRRLTPAQRWLWIAVLAMARQSPVPGHLLITAADEEVEPLSESDLADAAAVKLSEVRSGMSAFRKMGMLASDPDLDCDVVAKWGDRQFESDEVAERTRKHRSNKAGRNAEASTLERSNDVPGNSHESEVGTPPENIGFPETDHHHPQTTSSCGNSGAEGEDDRNQPKPDRHSRALAACDLLAGQVHQARVDAGKVHTSGPGHLRSCRESARSDHLEQAEQLAHEYPDATVEEIAGEIQALAVASSTNGFRAPGEVDQSALYEAAKADRQEFLASDPPVAELDPVRGLAGAAAARAALEAQRAKTAGAS